MLVRVRLYFQELELIVGSRIEEMERVDRSATGGHFYPDHLIPTTVLRDWKRLRKALHPLPDVA